MADFAYQEQGKPIRSGFFDSAAFKDKKRSIFVLKTAIAGMNINPDSPKYRELLKPGAELLLFREPENHHDDWAIGVYLNPERRIGYVTRYKNEAIARLMDVGKVFRAYVDVAPTPEELENMKPQTQTPTEDWRLPFAVYMED